MNKLFRYILSLLCMLVLFSSCSDSDESGSQELGVLFTISVPNAEAGTRADSGEATEDGSQLESSIDPSRLHVVLYDNDGRVMAALQNISLLQLSTTVYRVVGSMNVADVNLPNNRFTGKVVVYANIDKVDEKANYTSDAISQMQFDYQSQPHLIPMWGVKAVNNKEFVAGKQTDLDFINLLRAEAKLTVNLTQEMKDDGWELTKVTLDRHNTKGYCLPEAKNYKDLDNPDNLVHEKYLHVLDSPNATPADMLNKPVYVPEFQNKGKETDAQSSISLTLHDTKHGTTEDYTLRFVDYEAGSPTTNTYNIERNHHYKFEVYKGTSGKIHVKLVVRKWAKSTHDTIVM